MLILILAIIGLVGIVIGTVAMRRLSAFAKSPMAPAYWGRLKIGTIISGIALGAASWPLTYFMGYPYRTPEGVGRVVGLPFFVAFFDSEGFDYVGPITMLDVIANLVFWFLLPQIFLFVYARRLKIRTI